MIASLPKLDLEGSHEGSNAWLLLLMKRRVLLQTLAIPALLDRRECLSAIPHSSRIARVDTVYSKTPEAAPWRPHGTWIRVHADSGHAGPGETYPRIETEAAVVHSVCTPFLRGHDPRDTNRIKAALIRPFDGSALLYEHSFFSPQRLSRSLALTVAAGPVS